jgi:hypothetical protein
MPNPATLADRARKTAGAADRDAYEPVVISPSTASAAKSPMGRRLLGWSTNRSARDQDANRHAEARQEEGRCGAAPRTRPFHRADEEVMPTCITRLRQSWEEELQEGHGKLRSA